MKHIFLRSSGAHLHRKYLMFPEEHLCTVLLISSAVQNTNQSDSNKYPFSQCKLKMHEILWCLLQICVLLFTCLYIVCYLILARFKKTAEFVTGECCQELMLYSIILYRQQVPFFCINVM